MRSLSKSFKKELNNDNRRYLEWVDITLKDGTALYLREDSVWNFGLKVEDAVSDSSEFKIGSAIINKATVTLNNIYDDFTDYNFEGAEIAIYVGLAISPTGMVFPEEKKWLDISENPILDTNGNEILLLYSDAVTEKIRLCTMTVVEAPYQNSSIITLTCQDNMMKFDRDYSESKLKYPATRSEIIRDACNVCGVQLQTVTFDNDDYVIETRPDDQQLTFRQVLAWVAQIGGQFCRCDSYGRLCIAWYDLKSYESSHIDEDKFVSVESYDSLSINNEDVVITGIKVTEYKENVSTDESPVSYQYGEDGYVIEIKDNKLIAEGKGNDIATIIGKRIVGMRFRPFSASMMNNPLAEAGDICIITDRKGNQYKSLVTSTIFQVGNKQTIECGAKSAARNSAKQYSLASQAIVENRKNLQKERSDREKALEELSKRISQSSGLYTTVEESQGGGKVYYLHNKALLSDSDIVWKMTAEAWGVSTDGGNTWNGGMTVDGDTVVRILDAVGVRANWINTGEFKVADEKGNEVFYVNCDTGSVRIKAQEFSLSGVSIEEIAAKEVDDFVTNIYKTDMDEIKNSVRNKIETWYQSTDPSVNWGGTVEKALYDIDGNSILDVNGNEIIVLFEESKSEHEGDLWKDLSTNDEYIYRGGHWVKMQVPDEVFDEIDGKAQIFINTPVPPYRVGDLWFDADSQELLTCVESRDKGSCVKSDWQKKTKYTDDSGLNTFISAVYDPKIAELQSQIDGKIDTYYCDYEPANSNHPASEWTTAYERQKHVGDLFFWKNKGFTYRYMKVDTSYQWVRVKDADIVSAMETASKAQDTADGKRRNFITTPVPPYDVGDLWTQGNDGDLMRCQTARTSGNFVSSDWVKATKYTDDSAVDKLNKSLTSEEVFNRLTDNGKKQGIYMQGDQLYINFSYGKGGTLTLGGVNNENGSIQILDAIGAEVGKWDKDGLNIKKGSIYGSTIYLDKEKASALIVGRNNSKEIFTIGSMGMHIDNTNMGLLASDSMVVDLMGGWFHGLRMKASNNGRGYGSSISPECFSIGWAEDLQGWSDAMSTVKSYTFSISENSTGCLSIRINGSNYINDYVDISPREIKTTGTKNRVVPTENYSNRLQYCYETASPMFGDIGEGITDENGECIVEIGDIFTETVTTRIEYQVFLQKEGEGDLWIEKKEENYFIVHGTPNLKFAWELKAKQKDYEYVNLEEDVDREEELPESPENILNAELETLIKEQEELLNETA